MADLTRPTADPLSRRQVLGCLPSWLRDALTSLHRELGGELYLAGGVVRDLVRGHAPADIDLAVAAGATAWAERLVSLVGGALVPLGREEDAARVVSRGVTVDFAGFREATTTIVEDLRRRDLTINALAIRLDSLLEQTHEGLGHPATIIDPTDGLADLQRGIVRAVGAQSFTSDPLRLLRVFRFAATLGYTVDSTTTAMVQQQGALLTTVAPERTAYEMDLIMAAPLAHSVVAAMADCGLLWELVPELAAGRGLVQPESHHLDVWEHNLETLRQMESLLAESGTHFPETSETIVAYLGRPHCHLRLKWAALLHDLGKPATHALRADRDNRITFYNHDQVGAQMFDGLAQRLRWSNEQREQVRRLIAGHMHPFHLANVARAGQLTLRAAVRMIRKNEEDLPGLFLLAMADSLAGQGRLRIAGMEAELTRLYRHLEQVWNQHVAPVETAPPLLTGNDLIDHLHLHPGPMFKRILAAIEEGRMTGEVRDRAEALCLAAKMAAAESGMTMPNVE